MESDEPVVKDFGPAASLTKRRILGGIAIVCVLAFFGVVVTLLGDGEKGASQSWFGGSGGSGLGIWGIVAFTGLIFAIALGAHRAARVGMKDREE